LSKEYKSNKQRLEFICSEGHERSTSFHNWQQGQRCAVCAGLAKLSYEFIRESFKKEGYELLSKEYKNSSQKLEFICPKGHEHSITWGNWSQGTRCGVCAGKHITIKEVRESFEKEGYKLLSKEYTGCFQKLEFICPKGHEHSIVLGAWKQGVRCGICFGTPKHTYEFVKDSFEKEGYELLSKEYTRCLEKLDFICPNGHKHSISFSHFQRGHRCAICVGLAKYTYEFVKDSFEKEGYELLSKEYNGAHQKLKFICPKDHEHSISFMCWKQGARCGKCFSSFSKAEKEIYELVKSYFPTAIENDRSLIAPKELDIVIPEKKVAIEYCGLYWHSELQGKERNYHLNKLKSCEAQGYRLITIFEDEWVNKRTIAESSLLSKLGVLKTEKLYARNCEVKEISPQLKNLFLEANHLQGKDNSSVKLGLYNGLELKAVMTFSKPGIAKNHKPEDGEWELSRFCSDRNYSIAGAAGKLLKHFINSYKPKSIITFSDKRWSSGNLYNALGFEFVRHTEPNYWYITEAKRVHRFSFRKSELSKKLDSFDPQLSEWENMKLNSYDRIWDCGNIKWVFMQGANK
jgi:hypothetical protein